MTFKDTGIGGEAPNKITNNGIQDQPKGGEDGEIEGPHIAGEAGVTLRINRWGIIRQTAMRVLWEGICLNSTEGETDTSITLEEEEDMEVVKDLLSGMKGEMLSSN